MKRHSQSTDQSAHDPEAHEPLGKLNFSGSLGKFYMAGNFFFFLIFVCVCVAVDVFPTKPAEIKQTLPQMPFFSQSQLVVLFVVLPH